MKKTLFLALAILMVSTFAFAEQVPSTSTNFTLGGSGTPASPTTTLGLSNEVTAVYENGGATKPQWYAIGTYHLGGDKVFGTAQDITNIYKQTKTPGETFDWSGMPADSDSSNTWSSGVWSAL